MTQCSEAEMADLIANMQRGTHDALRLVDAMLSTHPDDARLHFLRGSMLAGSGRAIEAHASLTRALEIAPDFALARFQLGFFELTSGEPVCAQATWAPLTTLLPDGDPLRLFVTGLTHVINDRFGDAIDLLRRGVAANSDNDALNDDMTRVIDECLALMESAAPAPAGEASATSFLLGQLGGRGTMH